MTRHKNILYCEIIYHHYLINSFLQLIIFLNELTINSKIIKYNGQKK